MTKRSRPASEPLAYWRVHVAVPAADADRLRFSAPAVLPAERHAVVTDDSEEGDGETTLLVDVPAAGEDDAVKAAGDAYAQARSVAGLNPGPAQIVGLLPPLFGAPRDAQLLDESRLLLQGGRYDLAVIRAHTACEMFTAQALERVFRGRLGEGQGAAAARGCKKLTDKRSRDVLMSTLGIDVTELQWWPEFEAHAQRRNQVVHAGLIVTRDAARDSVRAVDRCIEWLRLMWEQSL